jgi:acetylxylan esterase
MRGSIVRRLVPAILAIAATGTVAAVPAAAQPPVPPIPCWVAYDTYAWNTGLVASIAVTHTLPHTITSWTVDFTLPGGQTIIHGWNANFDAVSGLINATNTPYNGTIENNGTVRFGFLASHTGNTTEPARVALNGTGCLLT